MTPTAPSFTNQPGAPSGRLAGCAGLVMSAARAPSGETHTIRPAQTKILTRACDFFRAVIASSRDPPTRNGAPSLWLKTAFRSTRVDGRLLSKDLVTPWAPRVRLHSRNRSALFHDRRLPREWRAFRWDRAPHGREQET